ncbi:hypothetical protein [Legionella sp. W05-934-2]|jgi:hypothetical protein|uniref:hypothetical protein n=1 Tax=Legionella sp. W05-934-2 TaxID=1198649 RepID=UPI003462FEB3
MSKEDLAMQISNARLICAIYFGLLAVVATIVIDTSLYLLGVEEMIPMFWAVILATVTAASFGALFGEKIIHVERQHASRSFQWGFIMTLAALPVYDLGFFILMHMHQPETFRGETVAGMFGLYGVLLLYSFALVGLWLAIVAGFAAMYLRSKLVYDILDTDEYEINASVKGHSKTAANMPNDEKGSHDSTKNCA